MVDRADTGSRDNLPDITCLIRSVQRIEGNPDCFGKADGKCDRCFGKADGKCDRLDCAWREYCLKETQK
ncbi:MAG: hypothetical protein JRC88_12440 [Deltaproteobacteria bacterium]|nr:hypothetical protein [Deltaproteobacteria bacterium]